MISQNYLSSSKSFSASAIILFWLITPLFQLSDFPRFTQKRVISLLAIDMGGGFLLWLLPGCSCSWGCLTLFLESENSGNSATVIEKSKNQTNRRIVEQKSGNRTQHVIGKHVIDKT